MYFGEVIGTLIGGLAVLLLVGGLLALFLYLLPTFLNRGERAVSPMKASEESEPLSAALMPVKGEEVPIPPRTVAWDQESQAELTDPKTVAAVGLALSLYLETSPGVEPIQPPGLRPSSPWTLAGRWQAMNARLTVRKR
ncbi:MAG: hypothetical protein JRI57_04385 [Deltaproteobacteria bacterium]|nr:hypothetical protein [Deltaproteobacteria bacterium]MBW1951971.1 hypothetical protein [Deltaproteobacteria bacterium]MBW1986747.1 hypothetical protein [Deltaproteobacteria bacterium]MBW2134274.1 hypothetical protein [Deltaproteobacteria bacterium]